MSATTRGLEVADLGTILGVWAHPDDEGYLSAGIMSAAVANGQRVVLAHATIGEHGTDDPDSFPPARMREIRQRELQASLAVLGIDEHHLFGLEDGTCESHDPAAGAAMIATVIDQVRPDTILTFGPDGITGHPDHRAISAWTEAAWVGAGRPGRLLRAAVSRGWATRHQALHDQIGAFMDGYPKPIDESELFLSIHLDDATLDHKLSALRSQASQTLPLIEVMGPEIYRDWCSIESFVDT